MSHPAQFEFIGLAKRLFPQMFTGTTVLEIGSLDVNGSVRGFFSDCTYLGLDIGPGPGVDLVCAGQDFGAPGGSFDVAVSCEVMEHNPFWEATLANMIRLLRPGGLLIVSCATRGRPEHGTARTDARSSPLTVSQGWNYYRNLSARAIRRQVDLSQLGAHGFAVNLDAWDLYLLGVKCGAGLDAKETIARFQAYYRGRWIPSVGRRIASAFRNPARVRGFLKRYAAASGLVTAHRAKG